MSNNIYNRYYFFLISTIVIIIDQFTKHIISINNKSLIDIDLLFFNLDYVKNFGAAFNLFSGSRIFLSLLSIIVSIIIICLIFNKNNLNNTDLFGYSFILGGSIGNGFDRLTKGYVVDFINLNFINFPVFNIADLSINLGVILLLYSFIKYKK